MAHYHHRLSASLLYAGLLLLLRSAVALCPNTTAPMCNAGASAYLPQRPVFTCTAPLTCDTRIDCCLTGGNKFACGGGCVTPPWAWALVALTLAAALCVAGNCCWARYGKQHGRQQRVRLDSDAGEEGDVGVGSRINASADDGSTRI